MPRAKDHNISITFLCEAVAYDSVTRAFVWRATPRSHFRNERAWRASNTKRPAGKRAETRHRKGYLYLALVIDSKRRNILAHRAAWAITKGKWPEHEIDHINRNRTDNRLGNLRETTHALVQQNVGLRRDNTSGVTGVSWYKRMGKWRSRIVVDGRYRTRWFDTQEEAVKARLAMKAELHPFAAGPSVR